ncbi:MAG TPA: aminoacyl-tRNA deacylase [Polyangiaceae bacterium]|nr:aminoacyl-tRNA deacylase [Polyangiaceae bacterium]
MASTAALRALRKAKVAFEEHRYRYEDKGGTAASSAALGVDEHVVIKTLVFETEAKAPLIVLMHGDRTVSTKQLARHLGVKTTRPCAPDVAERHTGYRVGGTSPFGMKKSIPVYAETTIFELDRIFINGGQRGLLVSLEPAVLDQLLSPQRVNVAT